MTISSISEATSNAAKNHIETLGGQGTTTMYRDFVDELEKPLLETVLVHCRGNKSRSALMLGMNRATLDVKLERHGLIG